MPPKGWRKNAEGQYPAPNKDSELTSIDDILFPRATVQKIAKQYISDDTNMMLAKESVQALQRSATVFVSHILHHARQVSREGTRKTVNAQDIIAALERTEFSGIVPEVKLALNLFEASVAAKKKSKESKEGTDEPASKKLKGENGDASAGAEAQAENGDEDEEEEVEEEVEVEEVEEKEDDDEDEPEEVAQNPHQVLQAEYVELETSQE